MPRMCTGMCATHPSARTGVPPSGVLHRGHGNDVRGRDRCRIPAGLRPQPRERRWQRRVALCAAQWGTPVKTLLRRMLALSIGLVVAAALGEALLRTVVGPPRPIGMPYFRDVDGTRFDVDAASAEATRRGLFESLPPTQTPRPRYRFAPGSRFFI